jgi:hypothetical protein
VIGEGSLVERKMPQEPELIEERIISGRGLILIPSEWKDARRYWLYAQVLRVPEPDYRNNKFPRQKGNYANILWLEKEYVCKEESMTYALQRWDWQGDTSGQVQIDQLCIQKVDAQSLRDAVIALGGTIGLTLYGRLVPLTTGYDRIVFECRDGCALSVQLWGQEYDKCSDRDFTPTPTPEPEPEEGEPFPNDIPFDGQDGRPAVTQAYDGENDGGDTVPYDRDEEQEIPPEIPQCTLLNLTISYTRELDGVTTRQSFNFRAYAPLGEIEVREVGGGLSSLFLFSAGSVPQGGAPSPSQCITPGFYRINRGVGLWSNPTYTFSE